MPITNNDWDPILVTEFSKPYFKNLSSILKEEYATLTIFPKRENVFNAFKLTPLNNVKAVIIGQDPYINVNQAHGLSFSVKEGKIPPSLKNIFKEIQSDLNIHPPTHGDLTQWATEGVLMLNTVLTVRAGQSNSHQNLGWETFTNQIISILNENTQPIVFMLWGNNAKKKQALITNPNHLVLQSAHPSPLAGNRFSGCKHFSKTNNFLISKNISPINWQIS